MLHWAWKEGGVQDIGGNFVVCSQQELLENRAPSLAKVWFLSPVPRKRGPFVLLPSAGLLPAKSLARETPLPLWSMGNYTNYCLSLGTFEVVYELSVLVEMDDGHTIEHMVRGQNNMSCIHVISCSLPIWNSSDSDSRTSFQIYLKNSN